MNHEQLTKAFYLNPTQATYIAYMESGNKIAEAKGYEPEDYSDYTKYPTK